MAAVQEFKVVLAGQFGTGKTTFATRVKSAKADAKEIKALKTTQYPVTLQTSAGSVTLRLFDTNLHAKGGLPDDGFFRTADAAIVFFDLTKEDSYTAMEDWYDAVVKANGRKGSEPLPVVVVGTKADDIKVRFCIPSAPLNSSAQLACKDSQPTDSILSDTVLLLLLPNRDETSSQKPSSSHERRSCLTARSPPMPSEFCPVMTVSSLQWQMSRF